MKGGGDTAINRTESKNISQQCYEHFQANKFGKIKKLTNSSSIHMVQQN